MGYWGDVVGQAAKDALAEMRWTSAVRVVQALAPTLASGVVTWAITGEFAYAAAAALAALGAVWGVWFLLRIVSIPVERDAKWRKNAVPPAFAETPLFEVTDCAWEQVVGSPPEREAYAVVRLTRDIQGGQLKIWAYESFRPHLVSTLTLEGVPGTRQRLVLASASIFSSGKNPCFGAAGGDLQFSDNKPCLVVIEAIAGIIRQEYRIQIIAMRTGDQRQLEVTSPDWNPYLWPSTGE